MKGEKRNEKEEIGREKIAGVKEEDVRGMDIGGMELQEVKKGKEK